MKRGRRRRKRDEDTLELFFGHTCRTRAVKGGDERPQQTPRRRRILDRALVDVPPPRRGMKTPDEKAQADRDHDLVLHIISRFILDDITRCSIVLATSSLLRRGCLDSCHSGRAKL